MTTIISRAYESAKKANEVAAALHAKGHQDANVDVIAGEKGEAADSIASRIEAAHVSSEAAAAYAKHVAKGAAVLVARVGMTPFGAAREAMAIADAHGPLDAGVANPNEYIRKVSERGLYNNVLRDHPRFISTDMKPGSMGRYGLISSIFGISTLITRSRPTSVMPEGTLMSTQIMDFPLLSSRKPSGAVIEGGGTVFSDLMGWAVISKRGHMMGGSS